MNGELVFIAAAVLAGPGATDDDLVEQAIRLNLMIDPQSPATKRIERVLGTQRFVADLIAVDIEESSTRAIITLRSDSADSDNGLEQIRTDRTDQADGRRLAIRARELVGRRVLVFKAMEDAGPQKKVRVCVHLVDIGPARMELGPSGRWARRHWEEAAASAGVTPGRVLEAARHFAARRWDDHVVPADLDSIPNEVADDVRRWLDKARASAERVVR